MIRNRIPAVFGMLGIVLSPAMAVSDETTTLNAIMQGLRDDLVVVMDGLLSDDFERVARGANGIANHPRIPPEQVKLVARELGEEMPAFKQLDTAVHDLAIEIKVAAESQDIAAVVSNYQEMVDGCLACHDAYKKRIAETLNKVPDS